jgi:HdeA/HdeB family
MLKTTQDPRGIGHFTRGWEKPEMVHVGFLAFLIVVFQAVALVDVHAQLTVDVSRATCAEFLVMPPDQSRIFSAWLMGYSDQKSDKHLLNFPAYASKVAALRQWCAANPSEVVMTGIERANEK